MKLPINVALFSSTKGHFDKDTYEYCTERNFKNTNFFSDKIAHIKYDDLENSNNLHERYAKVSRMRVDFAALGFKCILSNGSWKHFDISNFIEHSKDIATLTRCALIQSQPYVLWIEDDVLLKTSNLMSCIYDAIVYLESNPEKMCVRILDDANIIPSLRLSGKSENSILEHGDCFSFRANIMRSRDAYALGSFFKNGYREHMNTHIERYATEVLRVISGESYPFAVFSLDRISHIHLGSKEFNPQLQY